MALGDPSDAYIAPSSRRRPEATPHSSEIISEALISGSIVGHFRVVSPLGQGGMGIVYRAEDETLRREVALKVLPPFHSSDIDLRRRLLQEARAAAAVNHPNIATIYEVGEAEGRIYIAMELVQGETLRQRLGRGRLTVIEAISIARYILRGLQRAHEVGLVHRDLKPDNVMITPEGTAKVLDFGLAKQRAHTAEGDRPSVLEGMITLQMQRTQTGPLLGTPRYMSPEQAQGMPLDQRSDIFSFGVLLYEMLAGAGPFNGDSILELLASVIHVSPEPLPRKNPEVTQQLSEIVERCLAKDPEDRYRNCASVALDLERFLLGAQGNVPSLFTQLQTGSSAILQKRKRRGRLVGGLLALAVVAAAAGGFALFQRRVLPPHSAAPVAPTAITMTALPLPTSGSPDAVSAYRAAVQSIRDGNSGLARESLRRAVALDASMSAAHLRLAMLLSIPGLTAEGRESYARAVQGRANLNERDQALLAALEPMLGRDPPQPSDAVDRLRELTKSSPRDAELFAVLASMDRARPEQAASAAERAVELDPQYADAFRILGESLAAADHFDAAVRAFNRCVEVSPVAADCRGAHATQLSALGRCAEAEDELRRAIASTREGGLGFYTQRIDAMYSTGEPDETVLEAFTQKWAQVPEEARRAMELFDRARIAFEGGQLGRADGFVRESARLTTADLNASIHARHAELQARIALETGRPKIAARAAAEYIKRKGLWVGASNERESTMFLLRTMLHAGALTKEAFAAKRAEWMAEGRHLSDPASLWVVGYARDLEQREEAEEALAALAAMPDGVLGKQLQRRESLTMGALYMLAGRPAQALPYLRSGSWPCTSLGKGQVASYLPLAEALAETGDKAGACAAYAQVIERWGTASPRSTSAEKARAGARALGCAASAAPQPERRGR